MLTGLAFYDLVGNGNDDDDIAGKTTVYLQSIEYLYILVLGICSCQPWQPFYKYILELLVDNISMEMLLTVPGTALNQFKLL